MYMYMCIYLYPYIYEICMYIYVYLHIFTCVCTYTYIYMYTHVKKTVLKMPARPHKDEPRISLFEALRKSCVIVYYKTWTDLG